MTLKFLEKLDYRLPPDLELEYQDAMNESISKIAKVGIPLISVFTWIMYFAYLHTGLDRNIFMFAAWGQAIAILGFFAIHFKGKKRRIINYFTAVIPMAYVFGFVVFHLAKLGDHAATIQARNWLVWLVFFLFAVERTSPWMGVLNSVSATLLFYYLQASVPGLANADSLQFNWLILATHVGGVVICFDHCKNARIRYKVERELDVQRQQSDALLRNVLPETIVKELKSAQGTAARAYQNVTVLFADLVGFTKKSTAMEPARLVSLLDELFTRFDELAGKHGVEKIKTIGDAYMAATGCPTPDNHHAVRMVQFALSLNGVVRKFNHDFAVDFRLKVGVASGEVMGGVIGKKRVSFDLWGDVVNLASRIESVVSGGEVAVSESTAAIISGTFSLAAPRVVDLKGKGPTTIYLVLPGDARPRDAEGADLLVAGGVQSKDVIDEAPRPVA